MTRIAITITSLFATFSAFAAESFAPSSAGYMTQSTDPLVMGRYYTHLGSVGDYAKNYVHVGFVFFDLNAHPDLRDTSRKVGLSLKLSGVAGTPSPMRLDFIGTFSDTTLNQSRFASPLVLSWPAVITRASAPGIYTFDVSKIHQFQLPNRFAVFRLYQEGYISSNSITDWYSLGEALTDSWLHTIPAINLSIQHNSESVSVSFFGVGQFSYQLEKSTDLGTWTFQGSRLQGVDEFIEVSVPTGGADAMFYRVGISKSP